MIYGRRWILTKKKMIEKEWQQPKLMRWRAVTRTVTDIKRISLQVLDCLDLLSDSPPSRTIDKL